MRKIQGQNSATLLAFLLSGSEPFPLSISFLSTENPQVSHQWIHIIENEMNYGIHWLCHKPIIQSRQPLKNGDMLNVKKIKENSHKSVDRAFRIHKSSNLADMLKI
jgi:hypothetical protein